jgi:hypothetical protein
LSADAKACKQSQAGCRVSACGRPDNCNKGSETAKKSTTDHVRELEFHWISWQLIGLQDVPRWLPLMCVVAALNTCPQTEHFNIHL